jgi:hypothetical protein
VERSLHYGALLPRSKKATHYRTIQIVIADLEPCLQWPSFSESQSLLGECECVRYRTPLSSTLQSRKEKCSTALCNGVACSVVQYNRVHNTNYSYC